MKADSAAGSGIDEVATVTKGKTMREAGATNKAASCIEPAASLEDKAKLKPKRKQPTVAKLKGTLDAKVVEVKIEKVEEDYIQYLRTRPLKRPSPSEGVIRMLPHLRERILSVDAHANKIVDMHEDILRQYDTKGYAFVGVEYLDDGTKRLFQIPEEATDA
ncbi:unnamed protein product [Urochloa humidicola]